MPRRKPAPRPDLGARRSVAALAARLMAEDGISDYGQAKRKAARNLGMGEGESLPTNDEVEVELRAYQALYQDEEMQERLTQMRSAALSLMQTLPEFRPHLTGAVLDGTAGRYSSIELDLFADSAKDVEITLLSRNLDYDSSEPRRHGPDTPETLLNLEWEGFPVVLSIYPPNGERHRHRDPHTGHRNHRARLETVVELLKATSDS